MLTWQMSRVRQATKRTHANADNRQTFASIRITPVASPDFGKELFAEVVDGRGFAVAQLDFSQLRVENPIRCNGIVVIKSNHS